MLTCRLDKTGYASPMGHCHHSVVVGASPLTPKDKFIPIVGIETADKEAWLYLNHFDTPIANHPEMVDGKIIHSSGGYEHEMYDFADGMGDNVKWNMPFPNGAAVPKTIRFKLTSDNLTFDRQIRPTQAEIDSWPEGSTWGGFTCPEAEDSFAIRRADGKAGHFKYKDGTELNFGTGKVGHIYSMFFTDEAGAKSPLIRMNIIPDIDKTQWLMLYIEDAQRPAIMKWVLDPKRVGKLTLDPTIGITTIGVSIRYVAAQIAYSLPLDLPIDAQIKELWSYCTFDDTNTGMKVGAIRTNQASPYLPDGLSFALQGEYRETVAAGSKWAKMASLVGDGLMTAGKMRLGFFPEWPNTGVHYDTGASYTFRFRNSTAYGTQIVDPAEVTVPFAFTSYFSVYAVYQEPSAVAKIPPHIFGRVLS